MQANVPQLAFSFTSANPPDETLHYTLGAPQCLAFVVPLRCFRLLDAPLLQADALLAFPVCVWFAAVRSNRSCFGLFTLVSSWLLCILYRPALALVPGRVQNWQHGRTLRHRLGGMFQPGSRQSNHVVVN